MNKTIKMDLSESGIDKAIKELEAFQKELNARSGNAVTAVAESGAGIIEKNMPSGKTYDDKGIESGSDTSHSTEIKTTVSGGKAEAVLTVEGSELLFIEFGSGVHYNGAAGTSPHPEGAERGYTIGSYGKGAGRQDVWGYTNNGSVTLSHGTAAAMPVYETYRELRENGLEIAKNAFK